MSLYESQLGLRSLYGRFFHPFLIFFPHFLNLNGLMFPLFRLLARLHLRVLHALGAVLGWGVFAVSPSYRRRLLDHALLAGCTSAQWRSAVGHAGRMVAELPRLWMGSPVHIEWEGEAHIEAALQRGKGIIFLTPHLGSFEVTAQAYAQRFGAGQPMTVLFRPARKPWLQKLVASSRQRPGLLTVPTNLSGVKRMLKALQAGQSVGLLPDQVPPLGQGDWQPFFGRMAYTMTLPMRLAQHSGATVLSAWGERLPQGRGFRVHVLPLPDWDFQPLNAAMEALIRTCPEQYLWGYARYKTPRSEQQAPT